MENKDNHTEMTEEKIDQTVENTENTDHSENPDASETTENMEENPKEKSDLFSKIKKTFSKSEDNKSNEEGIISEIDQLKIEKAELHDKFVRLFAEFDNYKKRSAKDRIDMITMAGADVLKNLLPVLDDFERASKALEDKEYASELMGYQLIYNKLKNILEQKHVVEMNIEKGSDFDSELQEAIAEVPAGEDMAGKIVDVVEKGYHIGEKVLRFAKVVVGAQA